jgi:hypothetical protein
MAAGIQPYPKGVGNKIPSRLKILKYPCRPDGPLLAVLLPASVVKRDSSADEELLDCRVRVLLP